MNRWLGYGVLVGCGLFTCYVIGHYWSSLFKSFRNDTFLIFSKAFALGIYKRHFTWMSPIFKKLSLCLRKCHRPCKKCSDKLFINCQKPVTATNDPTKQNDKTHDSSKTDYTTVEGIYEHTYEKSHTMKSNEEGVFESNDRKSPNSKVIKSLET